MLIILFVYTAITSSPQSVNTTVNRVAIINCTYVGDALRWKINGQNIFDNQNGFAIFEVPLVSQGLIMSTLSVITSLDKNNTNITCTAVSTDLSFDESKPALLLLQGKLSIQCMFSIINLKYMLNSTIFRSSFY